MSVTISFTTTNGDAALLLAFHEMLTLSSVEWEDDLSPQSIENYRAVLDVLTTLDTVRDMIVCAEKYDGTGDVIRDYVLQRAAHIFAMLTEER